MTQPDPPDPGAPTTGGIEQIYAEIRAVLGGAGAPEPPAGTVAPGIGVIPLRTPTLPPATHTGCYLVGERRLIAIDPASPWGDEQARLVAAIPAGARVELIALTHHHRDHVGAALALARATGAPIAAHPATAARLAGEVEVTRLLADGERLATDGEAVVALHTPGHAPGHLVFQAEGSGAIIAGDLVAGVGTILIDPGGDGLHAEGHMATYLASLERLLALGVGAILPAHGPVIADGPAKLREYLAHRRMREERVAAALTAAPQPVAALVAVAYADTPAVLAPLAARSLVAHLIKLADDGRAVRDGDRWRRA